MPQGASQAKDREKRAAEKRAAEKKEEEILEEEEEARLVCGKCPVAKIFGLNGDSGSMVGHVDINQFFMHIANARKEIMLGLRSLLDEAIRIEDERVDRRQAASDRKRRGHEQLRQISIE